MKSLLIFFLGIFAISAVLGQTYSTSYAGQSYPQTSYQQPRAYPLNLYRSPAASLPCLTCNHCQLPPAPFNPGLPLVLLSFRAERLSPEQVELKWMWVSDERPGDIRLFFRDEEALDFGLLKNWTNGRQKEFIHSNRAQNETYYRLEVVDADGKIHPSTVRLVEGGSQQLYMGIFPNPAVSQAFVKVWGTEEAEGQLRLMDLSGRVIERVNRRLIPGEALMIPGLEDCQGGVYVIEILIGGKRLRKLLRWEG